MTSPRMPRTRRSLLVAPVVLLALAIAVPALTGHGVPHRAAPASTPVLHAPVGDPDRDAGRSLRDDGPLGQMQWYYDQRAYPRRTIPAGAWLRSLAQRARVPAIQPSLRGPRAEGATATSWTPLGPAGTQTSGMYYTADNGITSGRVTALAYDAANHILYAGAADGGLWMTTDGGLHWQPLTDTQPSLAVGAIALDPSDPKTIYVGTGEPNWSADSYYGAGLLKSTDGGATWTQLGQSVFNHYHISTVVVNPHTPRQVLVGADNGLWRSTDGGVDWTQVLGLGPISDLLLDASTSTVYAAVGDPFAGSNGANGIYRSTDGGATFSTTPYGTGYPTGAAAGRIALAQAPSSPSTLYMTASDPSSYASLGVWRSTDSGATWTQTVKARAAGGPDLFGDDQDHTEQQGWYDIYIAVDPSNAATVYVGGVNVFKSTNGGASFADVTNVYTSYNPIHPDQHALVFYGSASPRAFYVGNDGGVYSSQNGAGSWTNDNGNLAITQFYGGSTTTDFTANPVVWGGAQDNGTQKYAGSTVWTEPFGGDGGFTANDPANPTTAYEEYVYLGLNKTTDGGTSWTSATNGIDPNDNPLFIAPFIMDPTNTARLLAGTDRLYETTNGAANWSPISPSFGDPISAIALAPSAPRTIYVGTRHGQLWSSTDDGSNWTEVTAGTIGRYVTSLAVNPGDARDVVVTFSGFASSSGRPAGTHVYRSRDGGASWTDVSAALPDSPVQSVVRDPHQADTFYVGADDGFFFTTDGGAHWSQYQSGLPNVSIDQLFTDRNFTTFIVATHGRGMYALPTAAVQPTTGFSVAVSAGWNLIGLPGATGVVTASDVLSALKQSGQGNVEAIYQLTGSHWLAPLLLNGAAQLGSDFSLQPGQAYLVYSDTGGSFGGTLLQPATATMWSLNTGWNLVTAGAATPRASTVLRSLVAGGQVAAIYGLSNGAWLPSRIAQNSIQSGTDFTLQPGQGYLVYVDHATSYTPTGSNSATALHVVLPPSSRHSTSMPALPRIP